MVFSYAKHLKNCNTRLLKMIGEEQKGISDSVHEGQNEMLLVPNENFSCSQCKTTFSSKQEHLIKV